MINKEFISEFDLLYNNVASNQSPGFTNYEKSVFLTKAQEDILKAYLNRQTNKLLEGQDSSSLRQIDFSTITRTINLIRSNSKYKLSGLPYSECFAFPQDAFFILNEQIKVENEYDKTKEILQVIPLTNNEFTRNMLKPYKQPLKGQAWRIFTGNDIMEGAIIETIAHYKQRIESYSVRYIRRPHPIILEDLDNNSIEGYNLESAGYEMTCTEDDIQTVEGIPYVKKTLTEVLDDGNRGGVTYRVNPYSVQASPGETVIIKGKDCELPEELHRDIVVRAVEIAKVAYTGNIQEMIALGSSSATQLGIGASPNKQ